MDTTKLTKLHDKIAARVFSFFFEVRQQTPDSKWDVNKEIARRRDTFEVN